MRTMIEESEIGGPSSSTLEYMLYFRVRRCELHVVPAMLSERERVCLSAVRRRIDRLVEVGALSKIADIEGQAGCPGIYLGTSKS